MKLQGPPVLVTGATGFIGTHLCRALEAVDYEVHRVSRRPPQVPTPNFHIADLTDLSTIPPLLIHREWYAIFHLAGLISYTSRHARRMHAVNVAVADSFARLIPEHCPCTKFILCSSVAAVGSNSNITDPPLTEAASWDPSMESVAYISTKREGELVITNAAKQHLLKAIALCPSNVYGPGDAKKSSRKTQVKAANGKWPLYTDGGVNVVHIDVLVDAFMVLLKMPLSDPAWDGSRWLVTGENLTIRDMLSLFSTLGGNAGHKPWLQFPLWLLFVICWLGDKLGSTSFTRDRFAVATRYHWYNGDKARRKFSLKHIPARDAIADSVTWMRENDMVQPR